MSTTTSWEDVVRAPRQGEHLVQLYEHEGFLTRVVVRFLGTGLAQGGGAVVIATPDHVRRFRAGLERAGLDVPRLVDGHRLVFMDAAQTLAEFMAGEMPDRAAFGAVVAAVLDRVRAAGASSIRLFGEMVELLRDRSFEAALELERLWNEVLAEQRVSLLCAYRIDNFSAGAHGGVVQDISRSHSHLIPVEDYERLGLAVDRAYADVFGSMGDGEALRASVTARYANRSGMPAGEGALLALRALSPALADQVLEQARHHYGVGPTGPTPPTRPPGRQ